MVPAQFQDDDAGSIKIAAEWYAATKGLKGKVVGYRCDSTFPAAPPPPF